MKINKLNESSLVDKKVSTLGKAGKPMYFTDDQLKDAKAKYPEYDFEETTIEYSLPAGQKAYVAKKKTNESKSIKVFGAKAKKLNEASEELQKEFYDGYVILKNIAGDGWDIYSYDGVPEKVTKAYLEDEGFATLRAAKDEIDKWNAEAELDESHATVTRYQVEYYTSNNDEEKLVDYIYADSKDDARKQLVAKTKSEGIDYVMITAMIPEEVPASYRDHDLKEASYGGAFDIEDGQYFTRDDLVEFAEDVVARLNDISYSRFDYTEVYLEPGNNLELTLVWSDYEETIKEHIDMRKIRKPSDLCRIYAPLFVLKAREVFSEYGADFGPHLSDQDYPMNEKLTENAQGMGEYSDKFHAYLEFSLNEGKQDNIAYLASQLIRYCKEEDLKDLWFDRMEKVAHSVGFGAGNELKENVMDEFHKAQRYLDFEIPDVCMKVADELPNMTEGAMMAINRHCMRFKDGIESVIDRANESLEERFDGDEQKVVAVAFDVLAPVGMTESEIEVELTSAVNKSKLEVSSGYVEIHTLDDAGNIVESVTDAQPIETGASVGMAAVVSDLIKDEYEAIEGYNSAIATAEAEGYQDAVKVLTEIQAEENIHVGQLQEVMKLFDANADKVEEGRIEGAEQLGNNSDETPNNSIEEGANMKKERWEEIYDSFKSVETELNGDGEAVTAVVDKMYQDNKSDPDYKKAYDKWASGN